MITLYYLKADGIVKYVGLTNGPSRRKKSHAKTKPPHIFEEIETFEDVIEASKKEREHIALHDTYHNGWNLSPGGEYKYCSGYNRKGIGGAKKGRKPWNLGKSGCFSEETIAKFQQTRKGICWNKSIIKITPEQMKEILDTYRKRPPMELEGTISKNGRKMGYERAFSLQYCKQYNVTAERIYRIIKDVQA